MNKKPMAHLNVIDRAIGVFSPGAMLNRAKARAKISAATEQGYIIPGSQKKTMKGVTATANSPATDIDGKLKGVRAISRDMVMNAPIATSITGRMVTNILGAGLKPQIMPNYTTLNITPEAAAKWAEVVETRFDTWASSKESDYTGLHDFFDQQALALVSVLLNGDAFFTAPWRKTSQLRGWDWELQVQLIEADLCRTPDDAKFMQQKINNGVEFSKGRVAAYHIANFYEENRVINQQIGKDLKFKRVKLYDTNGRQNIYHLHPAGNRIGQTRGVGIMAPITEALKSLTTYTEAYLAGEIVTSLFTVFIKDANASGAYLNEGYTPEEVLNGGGTTTDDEGGQFQGVKDIDSALDLEMGYANAVYLDDDKDVSFADPKRDPSGFAPFFHAITKQIAAAVEIPAEQLLLEFNTSYSAARAGLLEAWKMYKKRRTWIARNFCQPVLEAFIEEEVAKGRIKAPGFLDDIVLRKAWATCDWVGPGQGQIDPLKEAKASVIKIQNSLATYEGEYTADKGGRFDAAMVKQKANVDLLKELGLISDTNEREQNNEELPGPTGTDPKPQENAPNE